MLIQKLIELIYRPNSDTNILYHKILIEYNDYYSNLNTKLQKRFNKRLHVVINSLRFIPKDFQSVSLEMKVLISSAIVQITFGLKRYLLMRFNKIYVLPYNYSIGQYQNLLGHVDHGANLICLSWPAVKHGFIIPDDAMNVALHEVAHALHDEDSMRALPTNFFNDVKMDIWEYEALKKMRIIQKNQNEFLKSYGGQNILEMFAVCIETFFEQPQRFKQELPELYLSVCNVLNQDSSNGDNPLLF